MTTIENKLKTTGFWLRVGLINHLVALAVIVLGCAYSGFSCSGDAMKQVLSLYAFTIFTPQIALEVILFMALFLVSSSLGDFRANSRTLLFFLGSLALLALFAYWK